MPISNKPLLPIFGIATCLAFLCLTGCGGASDTAPTPAPKPVLDNVTRTVAAAATAQTNQLCSVIQPFYWEIGDKSQKWGSASVNKAGTLVSYNEDSVLSVASASKWLYAAYVAERRAGVLSAQDIQFLHFRSGYTNFTFSGCDPADTVASCVARGRNGIQTPGNVDKFYYNGGHMQTHANLPAPGMDLGTLDNAALATEMRRLLGSDVNLSYTQPQLAGGVRTSAKDYAVFLRKLLNNQLKMAALLGTNAVCTNPATCPDAVSTPITTGANWHYSIGHWVEDDASTGDGAFSSTGAFGFYPWVDASKTYYGIVARFDAAGSGNESAQCGAQIRKAWVTGLAQ
ncbi:MAG: hypothetical protein Q7J77_02860 [Undibacterium sp.]|nr:hypothetical protein [Undibacterium sp.]